MIDAKLDLEWVRQTAGGDRLSPEMLLLMTLVMVDGYELFPTPPAGDTEGQGAGSR